jgi:hypothetical protein
MMTTLFAPRRHRPWLVTLFGSAMAIGLGLMLLG